jgi:hypothetical protein
VPRVSMDYFFLSEVSAKRDVYGKTNNLTCLDIIDHRSLAQATIPGTKEVEGYKVKLAALVIDN